MDQTTIARLKTLLVGSSCSDIENLGAYFQIIFPQRRLIVESPWRLIDNTKIVAANDSGDAVLEQLRKLLMGHTVRHAEVDGDFHNLRLEFDGGVVLEILPDSDEYENWKLLGGPEEMIIAGPGKSWSAF